MATAVTGFWLFKSEPSTYSIEDLRRDSKTNWNGIRNFQARNFLRQTKVGDKVLIYHSGDDRSVVGIAKVVKLPYIEHDKEGGDWTQVDIEFVQILKKSVTLQTIKKEKRLAELPLLRQSRLSVMPVSQDEFEFILQLGSGR